MACRIFAGVLFLAIKPRHSRFSILTGRPVGGIAQWRKFAEALHDAKPTIFALYKERRKTDSSPMQKTDASESPIQWSVSSGVNPKAERPLTTNHDIRE
jgi:hypothetical protein